MISVPELDLATLRDALEAKPQNSLVLTFSAAPMLLLFTNGAVQATHVGMASKAQLAKLIEAAL